MDRFLIFKATLILLGLLAVARITYTGNAVEPDSNYDYLHTQMVTNNQDIVLIKDYKGEDIDDLLSEIAIRDDTDNPYDGVVALLRGKWKLKRTNNDQYFMEISNIIYEKSELDKMTDEIADIVKNRAPEGATGRELFYEYLKYMKETFIYGTDYSTVTNAYYGDGKQIDCKGYSLITYFVANKLGNECEIISSKNHVYNAVRFEGEEQFTAFDLTSESTYASLDIIGGIWRKIEIETMPDVKYKNYIKARNSNKTYRVNIIGEFFAETGYFIKKMLREYQ